MSITWRGSTVTPYLLAGNNVYFFALVNSFRSRCNVRILRMVAQIDNLDSAVAAVANAIVPLFRTVRCLAVNVSGGAHVEARTAWDSNLNAPDAGVLVLFNSMLAGDPSTELTVTPGATLWQQFTSRLANPSGQVVTVDFSLLARGNGLSEFVLRPGEAIAVEWINAVFPTGGIAFVEVAWEEDQVDVGYTISGAVTLSGVPVTGAKVILLTDSNQDMPNPQIEVLTTPASGAWSKTLASAVKTSVFIQHDDGTLKYTDEGKPFMEKP